MEQDPPLPCVYLDMGNRIDCHRPGAIIPGDYVYLFSVIIPGSDPFERWNTDLAVEAFRKAHAKGCRTWGGLGCCGVCGAHYRYGDVWEHAPTGDLINLGHDCATKYELVADRSDFDARKVSLEQRRRALHEATRRERQWNSFIDRVPGLRESFEGVDKDAEDGAAHRLRDLSSKLREWGKLSEKQIAFALSLGSRRMCPEQPKKEEMKVPAPIIEARSTIRGVLVAKKAHESDYGIAIKGTIKITTPAGIWLAWGTLPSSLLGDGKTKGADVGDEIELVARLHAGREPHFAFFKRPTNARIVARQVARAGGA